MKDFSKVRFAGTFRDYQARVLKNANTHLKDGKIHIVAAPGSGKTILGLELIRGLNSPALVLSPSVTIRQQWGDRFASSFLPEGENEDDYISFDIRQPALLTSITYQALYSAWNRQKLNVSDESESEQADFTSFDLLETVKKAGVRTICLDEAHHLRSEWQRALEAFLKALGGRITLIALTATPPYDSDPAEWKAYHNICGDIDDEIFVPHLVAQKTLCPHQDYIIFSYPTKEEQEQLDLQRRKMEQALAELPKDPLFLQAYEACGIQNGTIKQDALYEKYDDFLCFFALIDRTVPNRVSSLPPQLNADVKAKSRQFSHADFERACQLIISSPEIFGEYSAALESRLRPIGAIQRGRVSFSSDGYAEKTLVSSMGKLKSITDIALAENRNLGAELRMLVLTDYIGQAYMPQIGGDAPITSMGAVQIFEHLRRCSVPDLAVLTGAGVILPTAVLDRAEEIAAALGFGFTARPTAAPEYSAVNVAGSNKNKVALVTEAFGQGLFRVLIGTKSLLGEGWDSPCINSLILASFVGSFMLSNQMRGRAIRTDKNKPDKASNIWHLVTLDRSEQSADRLCGADYDTVCRRFDTFLAPAYNSDVIESGTQRLDVLKPPFDEKGIGQINSQMYALAADRNGMKQRWNAAFQATGSQSPQIADTDEIQNIPLVFADKLSGSAFKAIAVTAAVLVGVNLLLFLPLGVRLILSGITVLAGVPVIVAKIKKLREFSSAAGNIGILADALCETLKRCGAITSPNFRAAVRQGVNGVEAVPENGTTQEQNLFNGALAEMLSPIENPRYLICQGTDGVISFACPSAVGNKKENAEILAALLSKTAKDFHVVYTRSEQGRQTLIKCKRVSAINSAAPVRSKRVLV